MKKLFFSFLCMSAVFFTTSAQEGRLQEVLQKLANVLNSVVAKDFSSEEQAWLDAIAHLRGELSKDNKKVGNYTIAHMAKYISIPAHPWGSILFKLAREFQPASLLDIGTCIGISAAYLGAGLELNGSGNVLTLESFKPLTPLAQKNFDFLHLSRVNLLFCEPADKILDKVLTEGNSFDFIFDDYIHSEHAVVHNFEKIVPCLSEQALYVFDDIARNSAMEKAWNKISSDPRVKVSIALTKGLPHHDFNIIKPRLGICLLDKEIKEKKHFDIDLEKSKQIIVQDLELVSF